MTVLQNKEIRQPIRLVDNPSAYQNMEEQLQALHIRPHNTCCSYGYSRDIVPYGILPSGRRTAMVRRTVNIWVDKMLHQGIRHFLCPMEPGIDLMVAERVIAHRIVGSVPIKLIACLTHPGMREDISILFRDTFLSLCDQADHILYHNQTQGGRSIRHALSMLLVKQSSHMLAAYPSGQMPMLLRENRIKKVQLSHIRTDLLD